MPTTVATPTDIEKAKAALRAELAAALAAIEARIAAGDDAAAIDALRAAVAQLAANEAADDAAFAELAARVEVINRVLGDVATRVATLELTAPAPPAPQPEPPPPVPLPPDPTVAVGDGLTAVARLRVPAAGRIRAGVAVAPGLFVGAPGRVRVNGGMAQADNAVIDRAGWLRWFLLSAIVPEGEFAIAIGAAAETAAPVPPPAPQAVVEIGGAPPAGTSRTHVADWRRGAVVTESVWTAPLGADGLAVRFHESLWADGAGSTTVIVENGRSVPGQVAARTCTYDIAVTRGAERLAYAGVVHVPYTRWVRRLGGRPVFAEVVPLGGGSAWDHLRAAAAIQNFESAPRVDTAPIDALPDHPFAVSSAEKIGVAKRAMGQPGGDDEIGAHPAYALAWLRDHTPQSLAALRRQTDVRQGGPYFWRDAATGAFMRPDQGRDWWQSDLGKRAADDTVAANQSWTPSHWPAMFRIPYLLWGELEDLEGQAAQVLVGWLDSFTAPGGSQLTRHPLHWPDYPPWWVGYTNTYIGDQGAKQLRTVGWGVRTQVHALASLPDDHDRIRALLGWDKAVLRAYVETAFARARAVVDAATGPADGPIVQGWGVKDPAPHRYFDADGLCFPPGFFSYKHWMWCYVLTSTAHGIELGEIGGDGAAWWRRMMQTPLQLVASDPPDLDVLLSIDHWPKVRGAVMQPNGEVGLGPAGAEPIRTAADLAATIRAGGFIGSREADWAGNTYALAAFAADHALPGAAAALAWTRANIVPNRNHCIAPR